MKTNEYFSAVAIRFDYVETNPNEIVKIHTIKLNGLIDGRASAGVCVKNTTYAFRNRNIK